MMSRFPEVHENERFPILLHRKNKAEITRNQEISVYCRIPLSQHKKAWYKDVLDHYFTWSDDGEAEVSMLNQWSCPCLYQAVQTRSYSNNKSWFSFLN